MFYRFLFAVVKSISLRIWWLVSWGSKLENKCIVTETKTKFIDKQGINYVPYVVVVNDLFSSYSCRMASKDNWINVTEY